MNPKLDLIYIKYILSLLYQPNKKEWIDFKLKGGNKKNVEMVLADMNREKWKDKTKMSVALWKIFREDRRSILPETTSTAWQEGDRKG